MGFVADTALRLKVKIKTTKEVVWGIASGFGMVTDDGRRFGRSQYIILDRKGRQV